jgi:hypothetical protein
MRMTISGTTTSGSSPAITRANGHEPRLAGPPPADRAPSLTMLARLSTGLGLDFSVDVKPDRMQLRHAAGWVPVSYLRYRGTPPPLIPRPSGTSSWRGASKVVYHTGGFAAEVLKVLDPEA